MSGSFIMREYFAIGSRGEQGSRENGVVVPLQTTMGLLAEYLCVL